METVCRTLGLKTNDVLDLEQCFSTGMILSPRGQSAMSGDIFGCPDLGGGATSTCGVEASYAGKYPTVHGTAPDDRELSGPQC